VNKDNILLKRWSIIFLESKFDVQYYEILIVTIQ
jgi:hypothetical protein